MIAVCAPPGWQAGYLSKPVLTAGQLVERTAQTAVRSLLREAEAGPKPGLVDRFGPGVHTDMDISHFRKSAAALKPFFEAITLESTTIMSKNRQHGYAVDDGKAFGRADATHDVPATLARTLRNLGLQAEEAMLTATGGVNTHKGAIWTMGLLCAAIGSLKLPGSGDAAGSISASMPDRPDNVNVLFNTGVTNLNAESVCTQAAHFARAILSSGLDSCYIQYPGNTSYAKSQPQPELTKGLAARQTYGLRSARDEALEGFPSILTRALPLARSLKDSMLPEDDKVISVLLAVMGELDDTCIVARGGLATLQLAKLTAIKVLESGGPFSGTGAILYRKMVDEFKNRDLSPGGSADLCAATLFLADMEAGFTG